MPYERRKPAGDTHILSNIAKRPQTDVKTIFTINLKQWRKPMMTISNARKSVARYAPTIRSLACLWLVIPLIIIACSNGGNGSGLGGGGEGNDISNYKTVAIGNQTWMAENLNYDVEGSKCYDNNPTNCTKYGRLYDWATAKTVCPTGWHLFTTSDLEWAAIANENALRSLINISGGYSDSNGNFYGIGKCGVWWADNGNSGVTISNKCDDDYDFGHDGFFSVLCVKDNTDSQAEKPSSSSNIPDKGNNIASYKTVTIGTQTWMAENLNYDVAGSVCYDNSANNCTTYGRLYNWATAMALLSSCNSSTCASQVQTKHRGICPVGWHIPSNKDWDQLIYAMGGYYTAGKKLKATSGWNSIGNGTNDYGFAALPGGGGHSGSFSSAGNIGLWWSSSEDIAEDAYTRRMDYDDEGIYGFTENKTYLFSVRCLKD
jgi:uncharacterized protein (TIGR02145 family)